MAIHVFSGTNPTEGVVHTLTARRPACGIFGHPDALQSETFS